MSDVYTQVALKAFNSDGQITALSYDGGKSWREQEVHPLEQPVLQPEFRIAAISSPGDDLSPVFERRIAMAFAPLERINIQAGWGPIESIAIMQPGKLDGIMIPYESLPRTLAGVKELLAVLKGVTRKLFLDLPVESVTNRDELLFLTHAMPLFDAVTVPSDLIAMSLRKYNSHIFCVPPTIHAPYWRSKGRPERVAGSPLRIALQPTVDPYVEETLRFLRMKYGDLLTITRDDWQNRSPRDEPDFYLNQDIVVIGKPEYKLQATAQPLLAPMMAGCAIVCDDIYNKIVIDRHSAMVVPGAGPSPWRKTLSALISDSRLRVRIQRGARTRSQTMTNQARLNQLVMPYRVILKQ
jgi:hypothetical protein